MTREGDPGDVLLGQELEDVQVHCGDEAASTFPTTSFLSNKPEQASLLNTGSGGTESRNIA